MLREERRLSDGLAVVFFQPLRQNRSHSAAPSAPRPQQVQMVVDTQLKDWVAYYKMVICILSFLFLAASTGLIVVLVEYVL